MANVAHSNHELDLSVVTTTPRQIVAPGSPISSVTVLGLPLGASFLLHWGSAQGTPIIVQGVQFRPKGRPTPDGRCDYPTTGIFASVPNSFPGTAKLFVTYGDDGLMEVSGAGSPAIPSPPAGFFASQAIPATGPAAPYHHFALMRNPPGSGKIITLRRCALSIGPQLHKAQRAAALEAGAIASTTVLVQKTDVRLTDTNVADFWTDPGNSTNGAGPVRFSKSGIGTGTVELIGPSDSPILLVPGDVWQIDETDSTTGVGFVMYGYDQAAQ